MSRGSGWLRERSTDEQYSGMYHHWVCGLFLPARDTSARSRADPRDEVLNGKTKDTNSKWALVDADLAKADSSFFAQYCFDLGIELYVTSFLSPLA